MNLVAEPLNKQAETAVITYSNLHTTPSMVSVVHGIGPWYVLYPPSLAIAHPLACMKNRKFEMFPQTYNTINEAEL